MGAASITVIGPTACGKTRRAVELAKHFNGEIISADSRQVYSGMSIGTGKDLCEYQDIRYHLIDIANAGDKYNLHRFLYDFKIAYSDIENRGKLPIICGGSGMYVENAISGISLPEVPENPELRAKLADFDLKHLEDILKSYKTLHNKTDVDSKQRAIRAIEIEDFYIKNPNLAMCSRIENATPLNTLIIGLDIPRDIRRKKISDRLKQRLEEGMIEEIKNLLDSGISADDLIYYGLEYKFVTLYVIGKISKKEMFTLLETAIHQFAKRQMTWFRGMTRRGYNINWLPFDMPHDKFIATINQLLM